MGDWIHVHHCVVAVDHQTALAFYERLEAAGDALDGGGEGPSGLRWGFWNPRVVLLTTTQKWGSAPAFGPSLLEGLDAECFTESDDELSTDAEVSAFEGAVRARLGAAADFLWCDQEAVMAALLTELPALRTPVTTVAALPRTAPRGVRVPPAAAQALADRAHTQIVHGFLTESGACFGVAHFGEGDEARHESPLFTPLAASRQRGPGAWAIHAELDGNELLPVYAGDRAALWQIERHGAHGAWQPRMQRLAIARRALLAEAAAERQAGCALARRWGLEELSSAVEGLGRDADRHVAAAASFALRALERPAPIAPSVEPGRRGEIAANGTAVLALLAERHSAGPAEVERAVSLLDDERLGAAARIVVTSRGPIDRPDLVRRIVEGAAELAELCGPFLGAIGDEALARTCARALAELAYASTRTSYWMIRYGVPWTDGPPSAIAVEGPGWDGEPTASAARIGFWARRTIEAAQAPVPHRAALGSWAAFSELLAAARANRVWWLPPSGLIRARLGGLLRGAGPTAEELDRGPPGSVEFAQLRARAAEVGALYAAMEPGTYHQMFETRSAALLAEVPSPQTLWCFSSYGRAAPSIAAWIANNLAWRRFERGAYAEALPVAYLAVAYAGGDGASLDTLVRVLVALGRADEGYRALQLGLARSPDGADLQDLAESAGYRQWSGRAP
ncbi:MAG: hypothetical protein U1E65_04345 [Myxococcota bacterium]